MIHPPASGKISPLTCTHHQAVLKVRQNFKAPQIGFGVTPIYLFDLASQQARWLTVRQTVIAQNVANANTPGYTGMDIGEFEDVFDGAQLQLAATNPAHLGIDPLDPGSAAAKESEPWEVTNSGNSVSIEQELLKAGEINREYSENTSVVKAFNQMLSASVKG